MNNINTAVFDGRNLIIARIDPLNRITTDIYNANRDGIATMDPAGYLVSTTLDAAQNVIANIDASNNISTIVRDAANRAIANINALNYRNSQTYDVNSNVIQRIDELNRITTNVMDALDRVQSIITPMGYISTTNRDADGRVISQLNASGFLTSMVFDAASRQIATISPMGIIQTQNYNNNDIVIGNTNGLGQITTTVRDAANRPIAVVNPMGYRSSVNFDSASHPIAQIDASGNYATSVWAANGKLIAEQNELGAITSFILDAASQRICVVDANSGRSTVGWDVRGLKSYEQDQLGVRISFTHDANENLILRVDARNWPTTYTIDELNRTPQTQYMDGTRVTNSWDRAGQQIVSADSTGITSMVWDQNSRKIATQNPTGINLTNSLDPLGNRLGLQDNYGSTTYSWDSQSRLLSIWNPLNERTTMSYDPLDREQHRVLANGGTISHTWDPAGREILIENRKCCPAERCFVATNTYSPVDTRLTVLETDGTRATFSYDASKQIISEARGGTMAYARSYVWDPNGNRIQQYDSGVLTTGAFNAANQQTAITPQSGTATLQHYDANGNLVGQTYGTALTTHTWSPTNKLVALVSPTANESYVCSDDGLRKQETKASGTTNFTYDEDLILLETSSTGALQNRNTDHPENFGGLVSQNRGGVSNWYGYDSQGSTRILVSSGGLITDSYSYKVFGEPLQNGSGTVNPHTYVGRLRYRQQTNGFYLLSLRVLNPFTGQFTSVDPIGFWGGWNPYEYVGNDPVEYDDPFGLAPPQKKYPKFEGDCLAAQEAMHVPCDKSGPRSCQGVCNCIDIYKYLNLNLACASLKYQEMIVCKLSDSFHWQNVVNALEDAETCIKRGNEIGCYGPWPTLPVYVRPPKPVYVKIRPDRRYRPFTVRIPEWAKDILEVGGLVALIAFCVFNPEFTAVCAAILPALEGGGAPVPA